MSKRLILLMILVWGCFVAEAQNDGRITVKGTIVDSKTGEPLPFVNLGLLGTITGSSSDMDGKFELAVPHKYAVHVIRVTAIGYAGVDFKVYELQDKPDFVIKLRAITYGIKAVDVYGELLVYKKMLRDVLTNISKNYIVTPYNYEGYFKSVTSVNGEEKVKEATVTIYDSKGYRRGDVASTFSEINYKFNESRRSELATSTFDGLTNLDDLLTADIVRNTRNVLDIMNSRDYKLRSKGKIVYEGDSVQVISYTVKNPHLSITGDPSVQTYAGEMYINLKDLAVLKNVVNITARNFNSLGRNLISVDEKAKSGVNMTITTSYKKLNSVYFLSGTSIDYTYKEGENDVKGKMEYITTRVKIDEPTPITGRIYYEDIKENKDFWNRYSIYFEE